MAQKNTNLRKRANTRHVREIIELAPGDVISDCEFVRCQFVGYGNARLIRCYLHQCNLPDTKHMPAVEYESCYVDGK